MENTRGSVSYRVGRYVGNFIIIDFGIIVTAVTLGLSWKVLTYFIPILGGCG